VRTRHISAPVPRDRLTRWLYTKATAEIVTTGEAIRTQLIRDIGVPPPRVSSIPTGIDPERFAPADRDDARRSLGLADRVRLAGNQNDVAPWLAALDVFALPSYANEGVPQALLQAMLMALP